MELSKRLQKVADFLSPSNVICDVGCDHGYVAIYLASHRIAKKVIAMDVNEGPLQQAAEHVREARMEQYIELRLSDGLQQVGAQEANAFLCAGMGGRLMTKIMSEGKHAMQYMEYAVLQPQSELQYIRKYIYEIGWHITREDMVFEADTEGGVEGKYYPVMRIEPGIQEKPSELELLYGPCLIADSNEVLHQYLQNSLIRKQEILQHMSSSATSKASLIRRQELLEEISGIQQVLRR